MGRRKKRDEGPAGDGWLATYADTITLLLTFFILLYSMSSLDNQKVKNLSQAFQTMMKGEKGTTILEYDLYNGKVPLIGGESQVEENIDEIETESEMYLQVKKFTEENNLSDTIDIISSKRGIAIKLRDSILFDDASSIVKNDSKELLKKIGQLLNTLPNDILVEGHTDNKPINTTEFPSNWELSVDRAVNVVRYFIEDIGLEPTRFSAAGYGEYQPVVPNNSLENMAKNRRVNILILSVKEE